MAQHDHDIANAAGATFRADLNLALAAIVSNNSGAAAPSPTFAHMWWPDTTTDILKRRNAANSAWMELLHFDETNGLFRIDFDKGADIASAATTDISAATGNYATITGTTTITALGTIKAGVSRLVRFSGALTLTHNGTSLILPGGASITTAAGDVMLAISEGSGNWRVAFYQKADGTSPTANPISMATAPPGISNGTDSVNDIDVEAKACRDELDTANMPAGVALGKQIDGAWVEGGTPGTPAGGFPSALTLTNDTDYHYFKIGKTDGTVDAGFDSSLTATNLLADATGYTLYRYLGTVRRQTATNQQFTQYEDTFLFHTPILDIDATNPGTSLVTAALTSMPLGLILRPVGRFAIDPSTAGFPIVFSALVQDDLAASLTAAPLSDGRDSGAGANSGPLPHIFTDTSRQIGYRQGSSSVTVKVSVYGYVNRRGRGG